MGLFGKSRSVSFFLSGEEQLEFLKRFVDENTVLLEGKIYKIASPEGLKNINSIPLPAALQDRCVYYLFNNGLGIELITEYEVDKEEYRLVVAPSPVVQFVCCRFNGEVLTEGWISAMLSYYDENDNEIDKPKAYVDWWNSMSRYLKKTYPLIDRNPAIRVGPGAIRMYKEGIHLRQRFTSPGYQDPYTFVPPPELLKS